MVNCYNCLANKSFQHHVGFMVIIKILGSLYFALFLLGVLILMLIFSTTFESLFGTSFAQKVFYQAGWFDFFLGLLAVNIVCSTVLRFPFKKKHTGFVITHIGILMLLSGCLLSRLLGVEGQMALYEGQTQDSIVQTSYEIILHKHDGYFKSLNIDPRPANPNRRLSIPQDNLEMKLERVWDDAIEVTDIEGGPPDAPTNHAIHLTLSSQMAGAEQSFWLVENNPYDPRSATAELGPALVELGQKSPDTKTPSSGSSELWISDKDKQKLLSIDLDNIPKTEIPIGKTSDRIIHFKYYPDARVGQDNKLTTASQESLNPAVEFDIHNDKGQTQHYLLFALFPEFESMHQKEGKKLFDYGIDFVLPHSHGDSHASQRPTLSFYPGNPFWHYESRSSKNSLQGDIMIGKPLPAAWMDFSFMVDEVLNRAVVKKTVKRALGGQKGELGVEVTLWHNGKPLAVEWLLEGKTQTLKTPTGNVILALRRKAVEVPFGLTLKDFRKVDYPGTDKPASFESDVALHDPKEKLTIEKKIYMNHPLDYKGYRIFQSSYVQDPEAGEASIFTVAKNPGILLIYSGACILFLGIFLTFFIPDLSSFKQ